MSVVKYEYIGITKQDTDGLETDINTAITADKNDGIDEEHLGFEYKISVYGDTLTEGQVTAMDTEMTSRGFNKV